ncbi:hypothetical protein [Actinomadura sp. KC345]|uniref:hypothetical protein n=1 Tax=Actinomadura sp. KC345 TaxID=2530371 RepID=UPI001FB79DFF|nr:hypothetical protein [Actinomadura sp. KC345]
MAKLHGADEHRGDLTQLVLRGGPRDDPNLPEPRLPEGVQLREPLVGAGHRQPRLLILAAPQHPQLVMQIAHLGLDLPLVARIGDHEPAERPLHQRDQRRLEQPGPGVRP